jgi:hypothetical protein
LPKQQDLSIHGQQSRRLLRNLKDTSDHRLHPLCEMTASNHIHSENPRRTSILLQRLEVPGFASAAKDQKQLANTALEIPME